MSHILHNGQHVAEGEEFEPQDGYKVVYVRDEGLRVILRDAFGEFSRPVALNVAPRENRPLKLGERRTRVEVVPDHRPLIGESVYVITHEVCAPGAWQEVKSCRVRATQGHAGVHFSNAGIEDERLRNAADTLWKTCNQLLDLSALTRLSELAMRVGLQEDTGKPGGWDDPALVMSMAELLEAAGVV